MSSVAHDVLLILTYQPANLAMSISKTPIDVKMVRVRLKNPRFHRYAYIPGLFLPYEAIRAQVLSWILSFNSPQEAIDFMSKG